MQAPKPAAALAAGGTRFTAHPQTPRSRGGVSSRAGGSSRCVSQQRKKPSFPPPPPPLPPTPALPLPGISVPSAPKPPPRLPPQHKRGAGESANSGASATAKKKGGGGDDDDSDSDVSNVSTNTKRTLSVNSIVSTCCGDRRSECTLTSHKSSADISRYRGQSLTNLTTDTTSTGAVAAIVHLPSKVDYYPGGLAPSLYKLFRAVDARRHEFIEELRTVLGVRSVSSRPDCWPNVVQMLQWVQERFKRLGASTELMDVSVQPGVRDHNGRPLTPPPVLLASIGPLHSAERRRVLVYLHVDVAGLWGSREAEAPPCELTLSDDRKFLHGRGIFECKGPLMCWLLALETLHSLRQPLPVSLKFIIQGAHEIGSPGLEELLRTRRRNFLRDVDMICVTKLSWLKNKPCVVHGLRGLVYFHLEVVGGTANLDSGHFGGAVHEPMADLVYLMNALQDSKGDPAIDGMNQAVAPVTREETAQMAHVTFDAEDLRQALGAPQLRHQRDPGMLLRYRWRMPTISFHGIEGAQSAPGMATAIPRSVVGKFSVRLVPHQAPERVATAVRRYVDAAWAQRGSANAMHLSVTAMARPWLEDPSSPHFSAARRAIKRVYKDEADVIRDGGSMEVVLLLQRLCPRSLVVMPLGQAPDGGGGPHTAEESMRVSHFLDGIKLVATYLFEVAQLDGPQPAVRATNVRLQHPDSPPRRRAPVGRVAMGPGGVGNLAAAAAAAASAAAAAGLGGGMGAAGAAGVGMGLGGAASVGGYGRSRPNYPGAADAMRSRSRRPASERKPRPRPPGSAAVSLAANAVDSLKRKPRFRW